MPEKINEITASIIGAAFEISNTLGHGFLETIYRKALVYELGIRGLSVGEEVPFIVKYKESVMGTYYCDLLVEKSIIVELKAIDRLNSTHVGQLLNYMKASQSESRFIVELWPAATGIQEGCSVRLADIDGDRAAEPKQKSSLTQMDTDEPG